VVEIDKFAAFPSLVSVQRGGHYCTLWQQPALDFCQHQ